MEKYITPNPVIKSFLAGSASGTCSSLFFQPLDLVKTRLQQNMASAEQPRRSPRIGGSIAVMRGVVSGSERGVLALWTGLTPYITLTVPGVGLYFIRERGGQRLDIALVGVVVVAALQFFCFRYRNGRCGLSDNTGTSVGMAGTPRRRICNLPLAAAPAGAARRGRRLRRRPRCRTRATIGGSRSSWGIHVIEI